MRVVDGRCFLFRDGFENYFNESEFEVASIMLKLSLPVVFSDYETPIFSVKWGATKPRTGSLSQQQQPPKVSPSSSSPVRKQSPVPEVGTSPSSCLSGDEEKTPPKSRKEDLGEVSSMYKRLKRNIFPVLDNLPEEMEGFSIPVMQQPFLESQRVFREQRAAKPKRDREDSPYVDPTSSKHKYYSFSHVNSD